MRALPENCVLNLYKMENKPGVGMVPIDRDQIRGPRNKGTTFKTVWLGEASETSSLVPGVFDKMVVTCYRKGHKLDNLKE